MPVSSAVKRLTPIVVTAVAAVVSALSAPAQMIPGYPANLEDYDPREVAMLPPFCMYTQSFINKVPGAANPAKEDEWRAILGPEEFHHLHHYCWGLMKTNRAVLLVRTPADAAPYLRSADQEFDYVIERSSPHFVLLPEIITKKGENLVRLNQGALARFEFEKAAQLKPDYWPPYAHMSDLYKSEGNTKAAREWLERGLAASPDAPALKRRLEELSQGKTATNKGK